MDKKAIVKKSFYQANILILVGMTVNGIPFRLYNPMPGDKLLPLIFALITMYALTLFVFYAANKATVRKGRPDANMLFIASKKTILGQSFFYGYILLLIASALTGITFRLYNPLPGDTLLFLILMHTGCFALFFGAAYIFNKVTARKSENFQH